MREADQVKHNRSAKPRLQAGSFMPALDVKHSPAARAGYVAAYYNRVAGHRDLPVADACIPREFRLILCGHLDLLGEDMAPEA